MKRKKQTRWFIRQRKKSDPIKIKSAIPDFSYTKDGFDKIEIILEMKASPDGWDELYNLSIDNPDRLGKAIILNFIQPVKKHVDRIKKRAAIFAFMKESRWYVAAVYAPAIHYKKIPENKWPNFFRIMIDQLRSEHAEITNPKKPKELVALAIAYEYWKKEFDERREELELKERKNYSDFKDTYFDGNPYIKFAKKYFKKNEEYFKKNDRVPTDAILNFLKALPPFKKHRKT